MNESTFQKPAWQQKVRHELREYFINFVYLAFFFAVFTWYRRLILAEYQITYLHYGIVMIEALVLAKVVLVGDVLGLGRRLESKPLIVPALYKAFVFSLFVIAFKLLESAIAGLLHDKGVAGGIQELLSKGKNELLAELLVIFTLFIPFFAFKELERILGEKRMLDLFFRKRTTAETA